jgi:pilus assembly protein CpaF
MATATQIRIDDRKSFQQLKNALHRRLVDAIDLSRAPELETEELHDQLQALAAHLCARDEVSLPGELRDTMVREILDEIYGFGPLEPLVNDPEIGDILVSGPDSVWVERNGRLHETDIRFGDESQLLQLIERLVEQAGRTVDERSPIVDATLPDGSRLSAVIPPLALRGPTLSIRRFRSTALKLDEMVRLGTLAPEMAELLISAVEGRLNLLISGGAGAGKTTLLNNLCRYIPKTERVVTIEETAELQLAQSNVVSLQTRSARGEGQAGIAPRDLLRSCLRMRPDRIIVGEARGSEVLELLQAMNTGHDGSMSTVHANDTRDALHRLELMLALSGIELSTSAIRQYVASAVQILVHTTRLASGERIILRISELCGCRDGEYQLEDIFVYRMAGFDAKGLAQGSFYATGYEPVALMRMASLGAELPRGLFVPRELTASPQYVAR